MVLNVFFTEFYKTAYDILILLFLWYLHDCLFYFLDITFYIVIDYFIAFIIETIYLWTTIFGKLLEVS